MPFVSQAQRAWMWANHPEMARKWEAHTTDKSLPKRIKPRDETKEAAGRLKEAYKARLHGGR